VKYRIVLQLSWSFRFPRTHWPPLTLMLNSTSRQATRLANIGLKFLKLLWTSSDPYEGLGIGFHEKGRPRGERREWPAHQILYPSSEHWTSDVSAHPSKTQSLQHSSKLASSFIEAVMRPQWSVTPTSRTHKQHRLSKTMKSVSLSKSLQFGLVT